MENVSRAADKGENGSAGRIVETKIKRCCKNGLIWKAIYLEIRKTTQNYGIIITNLHFL